MDIYESHMPMTYGWKLNKIEDDIAEYECFKCGQSIVAKTEARINYCPNCGHCTKDVRENYDNH